jgi:hypothetical protein
MDFSNVANGYLSNMQKEQITFPIFYDKHPFVNDFVEEIRAAISKENQIVKNQMALYHLPPKIELVFTDTNLEIRYSKGSIPIGAEPCKDVSFGFDYEDFENSELFGRTIKQVLRSGILGINFPNIPSQDLDFNYEFGKDSLKVSVCHHLPF